ncbi:Di-N-acetylchitobiase [Achlya hypogyna]|uniref:Di-N-acetylchitobiase n=1 Tax=Achlya hypogyna TaxID=1202772 RepID=A0A1V9Z0Q6_ACHHY|nr:Di-N-acetylchitobiase [Achlya hypogyna]
MSLAVPMAVSLIVALLKLASAWNSFEQASLDACPCARPSLCLPLLTTATFEVFAFSPSKGDNWKYYDYTTLTTIAWNMDKGLLCHAHERGVKIVTLHNFDAADQLCNMTARQEWITQTYRDIVRNYADGVNIDTESAVTTREEAQCLTLLVQELREELQRNAFTRHAQITFDVAWSPGGVDQRYYDYAGLAKATDYLFVMAYDMRSQLYDHCLAGANSPIAQIKRGIDDYIIGANVPPHQLILGLPWYAYEYPCAHYDSATDLCSITKVPFRGAPCSDAAGVQRDYRDAVGSMTTRRWDNMTATPYFQRTVMRGGASVTVQTWYDDPESLGRKFALAGTLGGVGMWHVDSLDYSGKDAPTNETLAMWTTLKRAVPSSAIVALD